MQSIKNSMASSRRRVDPYSSEEFDVAGDKEILSQVKDLPQIQTRKKINRSASNAGKNNDHQDDDSSGHSSSERGKSGGAAYYGYEVGPSLSRKSSLSEESDSGGQHFVKSLRRGSMSREQNQQQLADSLSMMNDYSEESSTEKLKGLKEFLGGNKKTLKNKHPRALRRSSISSHSSAQSLNMSHPSLNENNSVTLSAASPAHDEDMSFSFADEISIDIRDSDLDLNFSRKSSYGSGQMSFDMSTSTAPMNNLLVKAAKDKKEKLALKTDQIVESLVWFSFHTPRTVLEDLIANELALFRTKHIKKMSGHASKTEYKLGLYSNHDKRRNDDYADEVSVTEASESNDDYFEKDFQQTMMKAQSKSSGKTMLKLPKSVPRESALLFVDMSGFTKLSTMLDVESLSKVINSYFDMILSEVLLYGGDVLKFAGDAFFAEWKTTPEDSHDHGNHKDSALSQLNQSLASINDFNFFEEDDKLSNCVLLAARCAASIVAKFSDFKVMPGSSDTMLNVHCGVGVGPLVGLHVGDFKEGEEDAVELRREFLLLGSAIDQVATAADKAADGEVYASPDAIMALSSYLQIPKQVRESDVPVLIASRENHLYELCANDPIQKNDGEATKVALQPYESLRMHCKALNHQALARLHLQMALYVHPVIRSQEMAQSAAIQSGAIAQPTETLESRHRAEAELRSVYTIFINAILSPRITGMDEIDGELYQTLSDIMHVTSRELDRYSGHLRQFIVDDKGVVLIATFGLRGSTFPNMVANNGLPATFAIHRALKQEVNVENRVGATFGKVYCGVVGGVRRHEFAVMGAPVNLAARLMSSKVNNGILVDEAVKEASDAKFLFNPLPPVQAKGYDKPVTIFEPTMANKQRIRKTNLVMPFVGRVEEKCTVVNLALKILNQDKDAKSTLIFLMGESGMGKSALSKSILEDLRRSGAKLSRSVFCSVSHSNETEQRIPLSSYRKIFLQLIKTLVEYEGNCGENHSLENRSVTSGSTFGTGQSMRGRFRGLSRRNLMTDSPNAEEAKSPHPDQRERKRPGLTRTPAPRKLTDDIHSKTPIATEPSHRELMGSIHQPTHAFAPSLHKAGSTRDGRSLMPSNLSSSVHSLSRRNQAKGQSNSNGGSPTKPNLAQSLNRLPKIKGATPSSPIKTKIASVRGSRALQISPPSNHKKGKPDKLGRSSHREPRDDSSTGESGLDELGYGGSVPFFEKLCWICEELDYPFEYADIVGSQFLGLDGASPVTHIDGHVPTMDELVDFLSDALVCASKFADLSALFVDDFQWVDSFSWKIFRALCTKAPDIILICAMRSHDKQALRRLSSAATKQTSMKANIIEISLGPLDFADIKSLMSHALGHKEDIIPDSLCSDVYQRTGGLPVYVTQTLENIKRKETVEIGKDGYLQWTAEGLKEKRTLDSSKGGAMLEETFLSRFDILDVRVRKILQTCAVLGLSFSLSDILQVHPEMSEIDIENSIDSAVDEMILIEQIEDDEDDDSLTGSGGGSIDRGTLHSINKSIHSSATTSTPGTKYVLDRFFQFSHAMWRKNVLATMLKERKVELHRLIAESMERDQVLILEESDISRLLTLFDHWKACGDFCKSAPLALAVGARLEEWELSAQSLELYEDALDMAFDSVEAAGKGKEGEDEWVQVSAKPKVLDLILRLHIRIGLCHQRLGDVEESIATFEDAYNILKTSSKVPGMSKALTMPILSSLCMLQMEQGFPEKNAKEDFEKLLKKFYKEAKATGERVHVGRAVAMQAMHAARSNQLGQAILHVKKLRSIYDFEKYSFDMINEYGRDFALECLAESVQWLYLVERHEDAEKLANTLVKKFLPLIDPMDTDSMMVCILPVINILKLLGRVKDADWLLKKYVINPTHDNSVQSQFWTPLFNPLAYVLEANLLEDDEEYDEQLLRDLEDWVLDEENSVYDIELEKKAHALMGELCWRLTNFREDDDPKCKELVAKAQDLLTPIARYPHPEIFLRHTAQALLEAL